MSTRSHKKESEQTYVNGMEVSGIDPQIVREEQQPKIKAPMPQQYAMHNASAQPYDSVPFQSFMNQAPLQNLAAPGKMQQQLPPSQHRPQVSQQQAQQVQAQQVQQAQQAQHVQQLQPPKQQQQQQHQPYQQFPHMYLQAQSPAPVNPQARAQAGPQPAGRQEASPGASAAKPQGSRELMQLTSEARLVAPPSNAGVGKRRVRLGWTEEETRHLMEGCKRHGVGNWKKILTDPHFDFNCRTAVDLKDRFRTSFPEEYSRLYPNARTHKVKRMGPGSDQTALVKINRKERRSFNAEEDDRLLQGFLKHGPAWSKIQRDPMLNLSDRRSTDLRDRFRNAFPERYTAAGYKGRTGQSKAMTMPGQEMAVPQSQMQQMPPINMLEEDVNVNLQHNMVPRNYMPQHPMQLQTLQGMGGYQYFGS